MRIFKQRSKKLQTDFPLGGSLIPPSPSKLSCAMQKGFEKIISKFLLDFLPNDFKLELIPFNM